MKYSGWAVLNSTNRQDFREGMLSETCLRIELRQMDVQPVAICIERIHFGPESLHSVLWGAGKNAVTTSKSP